MARESWKHATASRHLRGYGRDWDRLRRIVFARDCGICQCEECTALGRVKIATEVDHKIPKAAGGTDELDNLQAINRECHRRKSIRERGFELKAAIGVDGWPV